MTGFACHPDTSNPPLEGCLLVGNHSIVFKNNIRDRPFKTNLLKRRHILSTYFQKAEDPLYHNDL